MLLGLDKQVKIRHRVTTETYIFFSVIFDACKLFCLIRIFDMHKFLIVLLDPHLLYIIIDFIIFYSTAKNVLRVGFVDGVKGQSHTLIAADQHDKRQWLQCLNSILSTVKKRVPANHEQHLGLRPDPVGQSSESDTELQPFQEADLQSLSEEESESQSSDGSPGETSRKSMRKSAGKENVKLTRKDSLTSLSSIASSLRSSASSIRNSHSSLRSSSSSLKSSTSSLKSKKSSSSLRKSLRKSKTDLKAGTKK